MGSDRILIYLINLFPKKYMLISATSSVLIDFEFYSGVNWNAEIKQKRKLKG